MEAINHSMNIVPTSPNSGTKRKEINNSSDSNNVLNSKRKSPRFSSKITPKSSEEFDYSSRRKLLFNNMAPNPNSIVYSSSSEYSGEYNLYILKDSVKGFSVYSSDFIPANRFICQYSGELLTESEAFQRNSLYSSESTNRTDACYLYYFSMGNKTYCIDSTVDNTNFNCESEINNNNFIDMRFGYAPYLNHSRINFNLIPLRKGIQIRITILIILIINPELK
jgi:hypothetical protein